MSDEPKLGLADQLVEFVAKTLNGLGLNGTRLQWKWNKRRRDLAERGVQREILWRSAKGKHKMCPSCRALVPRGAATCTECGEGLAAVRAPGVGRMLSNILPGATTATSLLLLVNGLFFLLLLMSSTLTSSQPGGNGGGLMGFGTEVLRRHGAMQPPLVTQLGEWWRLISANFLHGGLIHFGFNSYVLLQLGPLVEETYGTDRFWVSYLFSGISGYVLVLALGSPYRPVIGASCAIVGMIGLLLAYGIRRGGAVGGNIRTAMLQYAFYILIFSLLPGISFLGHAGGFIGGFLIGFVVPAGQLRNPTQIRFWRALSVAGVLLVLYAFYQVAIHGSEYLKYVA